MYSQTEYPVQPKKNNLTLILVIVFGVFALFCILGAAIVLPVFAQARQAAVRSACMNNAKIMSMGITLYSNDFDQNLPPADHWMDSINNGKYLRTRGKDPKLAFKCPALGDAPDQWGYALNDEAPRIIFPMDNPAQTPMLFESTLTIWNAHGLLATVPVPSRHKTNTVAFMDGHVQSFNENARIPTGTMAR